ncbi:MAG: M28 family peptidase [Chloroflexi bacterium]|nr:M28 family peptidase [Chloroflexota bacterium]
MQQRDVEILASNAGRMVGTPGHEAARAYITERLIQIGIKGYDEGSHELPYQRDGGSFVNVVGCIPGENRELPAVLLGAHYDTCGPYPGADDNAAAIAVLLSIAEQLKDMDLEREIILAFFDGEEPPNLIGPAMGSIRFYEDHLKGDIHCAIIMDLIGHDVPVPGLADLLFVTGMESDPGLEPLVRRSEPRAGLSLVPTLNSYVGDMSDHHVFRANRLPYLFLTCGRWEHYHRDTDTPEKLSYTKIKATTKYLLDIAVLACSTQLNGPFEGYDTTQTEAYFLRKNVQPALERLGLKMDLDSRRSIDQLANLMMTHFNL